MSSVYHNSFYAMGTRCQVVLPGIEPGRGDQVFYMIKDEINRVETCLSRFIPYSEISIINQKAFQEAVPVSNEIYQILKTCRDYHKLTAGAFDITLRPLLNYWKQKQDNQESTYDLYDILDNTGMRHISFDDVQQTIQFHSEMTEIDLGGFGKGYALQKVEEHLAHYNIGSAFISFGESSILTRGHHPAGDHWKIGLNNYVKPGSSIYTFAVNEGSVSTSANFYLDDHGKLQNHRHVINPRTGYPVEQCMTVSVCAGSPVLAEILSTAYLVLTDDTIATIKEELPSCDIVKVLYDSGEAEIRMV